MISPAFSSDHASRYGAETPSVSVGASGAEQIGKAWHLEEPQAVTPAIHPLLGPRVVVGRSASADLVLHHRDVSRRHLQLTRAGPAYHVKDLGSRFGTAVNGRALGVGRAHVLGDGDLLRIGRRVFTVRRSSPQVAAAARELDERGGHLHLHPLASAAGEERPIRLDGLGPWVVGRQSIQAALPLPDAGVSRQHAVFVRRGHTYWVRDLSQVGTTAGGTRLAPGELMRLVDGDVVGFQDVRFRVEFPG